jgi:hypothetical protein
MRFYKLEQWLSRQLDRVPWRWVIAAWLAACAIGWWVGKQ